MTPENALEKLKWCYAVKKFDSTQKIPDSVWQVLEQSLVLVIFLVVLVIVLNEILLDNESYSRAKSSSLYCF